MFRFLARLLEFPPPARPLRFLLLVVTLSHAGCAISRGRHSASGPAKFHAVNPDFYRSAQPRLEGFPALAQLGFKTVINLRMTDDVLSGEAAAAQAQGLVYRHVPLSGWTRPTDQDVQFILALIESSAKPVLLHCERGADRTGTIVACYRIRHEGWTADRALAEAKQHGLAWIEVGMRDYVRDFAVTEKTRPRP